MQMYPPTILNLKYFVFVLLYSVEYMIWTGEKNGLQMTAFGFYSRFYTTS